MRMRKLLSLILALLFSLSLVSVSLAQMAQPAGEPQAQTEDVGAKKAKKAKKTKKAKKNKKAKKGAAAPEVAPAPPAGQ